MKGILAVNHKNVIGIGEYLPWKSSDDFKHFRDMTMGCNLLVGYNTFSELPKLPGRRIFIEINRIPGKHIYKYDKFNEVDYTYHHIDDISIKDDRDINYVTEDTINTVHFDWCIGGKKTFEKYCHLFTELHISHINDNSDGDILYPDFKNLNPDCKIFHYYFDIDK
jgi:dihydrofolate reductase